MCWLGTDAMNVVDSEVSRLHVPSVTPDAPSRVHPHNDHHVYGSGGFQTVSIKPA